MRDRLHSALLAALTALVITGFSACATTGGGGDSAEAKGNVAGSVEAAARATEEAFTDLGITKVDAGVMMVFANVVGKAKTGTRVVVAIHRKGDAECEVTVATDGPADAQLGAAVLKGIGDKLP